MTALADLLAHVDAVRARVAELATMPGPVAFPARGGGSVAVTPDASKPGRWRATRLDADGTPTGHVEAADFSAALRAAHERGADLFSPIVR